MRLPSFSATLRRVVAVRRAASAARASDVDLGVLGQRVARSRLRALRSIRAFGCVDRHRALTTRCRLARFKPMDYSGQPSARTPAGSDVERRARSAPCAASASSGSRQRGEKGAAARARACASHAASARARSPARRASGAGDRRERPRRRAHSARALRDRVAWPPRGTRRRPRGRALPRVSSARCANGGKPLTRRSSISSRANAS